MTLKNSYFNIPNDDEIDEFLTKVDDITTKVRNILDNKMSLEEIEKEERKLYLEKRAKEIKEEEKKEKEKRAFIMGREGKGNENNYLYFCRSCFVEYSYELQNCKRCNELVITKEQRKKELEEKVKIYKNGKDKRNIRRNNWKQFLQSHRNEEKKKITSYEKWNYYEPSSDTYDEDEKTLYVPKHNKNFQILEKKMDEDIKKRNENRKIAYNLKQKGNNFFKNKNYLNAIECYKNALNICKDYLEVYNNLALCEIKIYQYENAIENCNKVIEYYDIFQKDLKVKKLVIFKSYARKGLALFKLHKFEESLQNFKLALSMCPDDEETIEYIKKCEKILEDYNQVQKDELFSNTNRDPEKIAKEKIEEKVEEKEYKNKDQSNINNNDLSEDNYDHAIMELSKMDIRNNRKLFSVFLKNMRKFLKKNKKAKLKFCSCTYEIKDKKEKVKKVTFLSFLVEKINDILFYIKKEINRDVLKGEEIIKNENFHIPKYLRKCGSIIIDIFILILEDSSHYSDFCVNALKPVLTFYFLKICKICKCINFLLFIGENYEARKLFYNIVENNNYTLKFLLDTMNDYITEQRRTYTKEKLLRFEYIRSNILKSVNEDVCEIIKVENNKNCIRKKEKKNENSIDNNKCNNKINSNENASILQKNTSINVWNNSAEKKLEEKKKMEYLFEKKYEFVNLFGILSNFTLETNVLNLLEKKFMKDILNVIIFINEKFYDYNDMHCNYLSFLVNLVGNIKIRSILLNTCLPHMFYFIEQIENESLMKNLLSVIFNLTITWTSEIENKKFSSFDKEIKRSSFHKLIKCTQSIDKQVSELSFLLLSRFYLYIYYLSNKVQQPHNDNCNDNVTHNNNENTDHNSQLISSLKKSIYKENGKLIPLDNYSFFSLKKSILITLSRKKEFSLIKSCINLVFCLSKYTNFLNLLSECDEDFTLKKLTSNVCSIFLDTQNNTINDKTIYALINNIIMFLTLMLKMVFIKPDYNNKETLEEIRKIIPFVNKILSSTEKTLKKNVQIFLSYCFLNNHLKQTFMSLYNNDINQIYYILKVS